MPSDKYPDAGARDALRAATEQPVNGVWTDEQDRQRTVALAELLDATLALFGGYGLKVEKFSGDHQNRELAGAWGFHSARRDAWLVLRARASGRLQHYWWAWGEGHQGGLECSLAWDQADGIWLGTALNERDFTLPGYPLRRLSALETLTVAIIKELRLGETT